MKLDLWLYKMERKISKIAIERLMSLLTVAMAMVFAADVIFSALAETPISLYSLLYFDRAAIFSGQIWRIFSFIFLYPDAGNIILTALALYFYWWTGNSVEGYWGTARFNLYYLFGVIGSIIAGLIVGGMTNMYLNLSIFLAFSVMFPDVEVLLFFIIPVKVKWLGIFEGAMILILFIFSGAVNRAAIIAALLNFLLFFGRDLVNKIKCAYREYKWKRGR